MSRVVDVHTHVVPDELLAAITAGGTGHSIASGPDGERRIRFADGYEHPTGGVFGDVEEKVAEMDADGVDVALVSPSPSVVLAIDDPGAAREACAAANEGALAMAARSDGRLLAMAALPMADAEVAATELERAIAAGCRGGMIGSSAGDVMLSDERLAPVFAAAEAVGAPLLVHPYRSMIGRPPPGLDAFHLANVAGNPNETFIAVAHLVLGGTFDRHPRLDVVLAHGGGSAPYQLGRLAHAHFSGPKPGRIARASPTDYLDCLLFDTIVYEQRALRFLLETAGPDRVLFGSDRPFDMADVTAIAMVEKIDRANADAILGGNAICAFGLDA